MTHYNVFFLFRGQKRFTFEKSFALRSIAINYAEKVMNESVYMQHLIIAYKITTSPEKRY